MTSEPAPSDREERLQEILLACLQAADLGQTPDPEEVLAAHPDLAEELRTFFADQDRLHRLLSPLQSLVTPVPDRDTFSRQGLTGPLPGEAVTQDPARTRTYGGREGEEGIAAGPPALPGFEILGELGRGGMGVVYQARQVALDRVVALKLIHGRRLDDEALRARFRAEARAVARFDHPHIVKIYECGEQAGTPYFALEFVAGGNLAQAGRRRAWSPREAAELVARLADAVEYAHRQHIIHRDLKPANILLTADGSPKIADFGLAKRLEADAALQTVSGALVGTPQFMSPEQAAGGSGTTGPGADVFGLGGILYYLLTGQPPHQGDTLLEVVQQARQGQVPPPRQLNPAVPAELDRICRQALSPDPAGRYPTAAALERDLRRFLDRPRRLRNRLLAGTAAVLLLGLTAAVLLLSLPRDEKSGSGASEIGRGERRVQPAVQPEKPGAAEALRDERLVVRIWSPDGAKKGLRLGVDPGALPARPGDRIRVEVRLNRPAYIYLLALDAQGGVTPLYPWHKDVKALQALTRTLDDPPPAVPPRTELFWPSRESGGLLPLDENSGLETILLLVRRTPLRDGKVLPRLIGRLPLPASPLGEDEEAFSLRGGGDRPEDAIRLDQSRGFGKRLEKLNEPLEQLLGRLGKEFELLRAVRFAHKGS